MKTLTPIKAIRAKCLDCAAGSVIEVNECPFPDCSLYPYRHGKNPNRKGIVHEGSFKAKNTASTNDSANEICSEGNCTTGGSTD